MNNEKDARYIHQEKMMYRPDNLSFWLVILGIALDVVYFITLYRNNNNYYYNYEIGISIIYNLIFMLFMFWSAEEVKNYHRNYAFIVLSLGLFQILRIFYLPKKALEAGILSSSQYTILVVYLSLSSLALVIAFLVSLIRSSELMKFKKHQEEGGQK